jgi:hypothetical protein
VLQNTGHMTPLERPSAVIDALDELAAHTSEHAVA